MRSSAYVTLLRAGEVFRRLRGQIRREGIKSDFLEKPDVKEACRRYEREWDRRARRAKVASQCEGTSVPGRLLRLVREGVCRLVK